AVLFVVQRMESLSHTFVFLGLWLYLHGRRRQRADQSGWAWILAGLLPCTLLGLLAKESAVLLPAYAFCLEFCLFRFLVGHRRDAGLIMFYGLVLFLPALTGVAWLLPKFLAPDAFATRNFTLLERLLTEPRVLLEYLHWTLLPDLSQLSLYHDDFLPSRDLWTPPSTFFSLIVLALLFTVACLARDRRPLLTLGLLWFFAAHLLTATFIPLELVFEHRNYFASLGICLVLADLLLFAPRLVYHPRIGRLVAAVFVLFCAGNTFLRASEWNSPVRFAMTEAAKHPQSARATYDLGRVLVVLSNYRPESPFTTEAFQALEKARRVPGGNILADQAALILEARSGSPTRDVWWQDMQSILRRRPLGPQPIAALGSLTHCAVEKRCNFPQRQMFKSFEAALSHGPNPEVLNIYGDYVLNVQGDPESALRMWQHASDLQPEEVQYRRNLSKLLIVLGRYDDARAQLQQLARIGRFGQNEAVAKELAVMLAEHERHAPGVKPDAHRSSSRSKSSTPAPEVGDPHD
ncbi:MAG: tetratricopeptide repeat protein, partial [Arenimonas sp.]